MAEPNARNPWSTPRHEDETSTLRVPRGFDPRVDEANRVSAYAQQVIDASRKGLEEDNIRRRAEGKPERELPPKANPWSTPRNDSAVTTPTTISSEQAATTEIEEQPTTVVEEPSAQPVPAAVQDTAQPVPAPSPTVQQTEEVLSKEPPTIEPEQQRRTSRIPARVLASRQEPYRPAAMLEEGLETAEEAWMTAKDIAQGAYSGALKGIQNQVRDIDRAARWLEKNVAGFGGIWIDEEGVHILSSKELRDKGGPVELKNIIPEADDPEGVAGFMTQGIAQFLAGFAVGGGVVKGIGGATKTGRVAEVMFRSAIADATVWDDHEARLADLVQSFDVLGPVGVGEYKTDIHKQFVDYLAADTDDSIALDKFKAATEGLILGGLFAPFIRSTQAFKKARQAKARAAIEARSPLRAKIATSETAERASKLADEAAEANQDIAQQAIKEFEESLPKPKGWKEGDDLPSISTVNPRTKLLEIDPEKIRGLGKERARQLYHAERAIELRQEFGDPKLAIDHPDQPIKFRAVMQQTEEALAAGKFDEQMDALTSPLLNPEKFNHIVGIASDLKKANPDLWDDSFRVIKTGPRKGQRVYNKTVIDNLFDLTVQKKLTGEGAQEIANTLNKYGFSFDDYVLTIVGTGSEAGKVLSQLSRIRRAKPRDELYESNKSAQSAMDKSLKNLSQRIENIRRGGMVSQLATASRNLTSAGIRMPLEALQNVAETAMYNFQHGGFRKGLGSAASSSTWKGAFKPFEHAFGNPRDAKEYVDLILSKAELAPTYKRLFGNLNEIQILTGRGQATTRTGKAVDSILSVGEDLVMDLNIFNRLQEFTVRRAMFLGQLENLTKREWGVDLIGALNEGKLTGLLDDSLKPQGKRSFHEMVEDSTRLALDVTYAKQPDTQLGRRIASWITNASLGPARATWVLPFPRFMVNSLELIGQYAGGASIPLTKKFISLMKGGKAHHAFDGIPEMGAAQLKLTTKDRQRISRNIAGLAAFYASYKYRTMEDAPADYKMMKADDGTVLDTTPQFPMRQMLMVGELTKQAMRGDLGEWLSRKNNWKEISETFLGTNIRTGTGAGLMTDLVELVEGLGLGDVDKTDLVATEKAAKTIGRAIGSYGVSWLTPFVQFKDAQRWLGIRPDKYSDVAKDPKIGAAFPEQLVQEIKRPYHSRGFGLTPKEEADLPKRVSIGHPDDKRIRSGLKVVTGLSFRKRASEDMEYLHNLGYSEWAEGSKSKVPTIRRYENAFIQKALPSIVEELREQEVDLRAEYKTQKPEYKKEVSEDQHVRAALRPLANDMLQEERTAIAEASIAAYEGDDEAMKIYHAQTRYRRLSKDRRNASVKLFYQTEGRWPVFTNSEDLESLSEYATATGLGGSDSPLQD